MFCLFFLFWKAQFHCQVLVTTLYIVGLWSLQSSRLMEGVNKELKKSVTYRALKHFVHFTEGHPSHRLSRSACFRQWVRKADAWTGPKYICQSLMNRPLLKVWEWFSFDQAIDRSAYYHESGGSLPKWTRPAVMPLPLSEMIDSWLPVHFIHPGLPGYESRNVLSPLFVHLTPTLHDLNSYCFTYNSCTGSLLELVCDTHTYQPMDLCTRQNMLKMQITLQHYNSEISNAQKVFHPYWDPNFYKLVQIWENS